MMAKLLPIIFLLLGIGAGVGAGIALAPGSPPPEDAHAAEAAKPDSHEPDSHGAEEGHGSENEFIRMNNQFVIPVIKNEMIAALVVMSLSLETRQGLSDDIYAREPKLRDVFLRVMFDHAGMGGFHGDFTNPEILDLLRSALLQVAQKELGPDVLNILIVDIVRQDT